MSQTELPPQDTASEQAAIGVTCMIEGLLLAGFLVFLHETLQPGFKGGGFILSCLVLSTAFLVAVLARDVWIAVSKPSHACAPAVISAWRVIGLSFASVAVLLGSTLVFGMVVAMPAVAFLILRWHMHLPLWRAGAVALLLGTVIPIAFSLTVGMPLWAGMIPEVIPYWVGGGILPSLQASGVGVPIGPDRQPPAQHQPTAPLAARQPPQPQTVAPPSALAAATPFKSGAAAAAVVQPAVRSNGEDAVPGEGGETPAGESDYDEDDMENSPSLAAIEAELKPKVVETFDNVADTYKRLRRLQDQDIQFQLKNQ